MRVAYVYMMRDDPRVAGVAPRHAAYWHGLDLFGYEGGPFEDRSGGLIVFECESMEGAHSHVAHDPFVTEDLLMTSWLKQWSIEPV